MAAVRLALESHRGGGGVLPYIGYIRVCAAGKGMVFKPFILIWGLVIMENWSSIGSRLTGSLTLCIFSLV